MMNYLARGYDFSYNLGVFPMIMFCCLAFFAFIFVFIFLLFILSNNKRKDMTDSEKVIMDISDAFMHTAEELSTKVQQGTQDSKELVKFAKEQVSKKLEEVEAKYKDVKEKKEDTTTTNV